MPSIAQLNARAAALSLDDLELVDESSEQDGTLLGSVESLTESISLMYQRTIKVVDQTISSLRGEDVVRPEEPEDGPQSVETVGPSVVDAEQTELLTGLADSAETENDLQKQILSALGLIQGALVDQLSYFKKRDNRPEVLTSGPGHDYSRPEEYDSGETIASEGGLLGGLMDMLGMGGAAAGAGMGRRGRGARGARGGFLGRMKNMLNPTNLVGSVKNLFTAGGAKTALKSVGKAGAGGLAVAGGLGLATEVLTNFYKTGELGLGGGMVTNMLGLTDQQRIERLSKKKNRTDEENLLLGNLQQQAATGVEVEGTGPSGLEMLDSVLGVDTFGEDVGVNRAKGGARLATSTIGSVLGGTLGSLLGPVGTVAGAAIGGWLADEYVGPIAENAVDGAITAYGHIESFVGDMAESATSMYDSAVLAVSDAMTSVSTFVGDTVDSVVSAYDSVVATVQETYQNFVAGVDNVVGMVSDGVNGVIEGISGAISSVKETLGGWIDEAKEGVGAVIDGVSDKVKDAYEGSTVQNMVESVGDGLNAVGEFFSWSSNEEPEKPEEEPTVMRPAALAAKERLELEKEALVGPNQAQRDRDVAIVADEVMSRRSIEAAAEEKTKITSVLSTVKKDEQAFIKQSAMAAEPFVANAIEPAAEIMVNAERALGITSDVVENFDEPRGTESEVRMPAISGELTSEDIATAIAANPDFSVADVFAPAQETGATVETTTVEPVRYEKDTVTVADTQRVEITNIGEIVATQQPEKQAPLSPRSPPTTKPTDEEIPIFLSNSALGLIDGGFI